MITRILPLALSVPLVALGSTSALGASFSLVGTELQLRAENQLTPTSPLSIISFPASAIVSETEVEFPDVESLFDPAADNPLGAGRLVDVAIDAGTDYLEIDFNNAGSGQFLSGFQNTYVFTVTAPIALQITDALLDEQTTTLGLTPERVDFAGNELLVNVEGLSYNSDSFVRIDLSAVEAPDAEPVSVPEPGNAFVLVSVALVGLVLQELRR